MTTLTFAANTIMAYVGPDSGVVGVSGVTGMPFWAGTKAYFLQTAALTGPGIRQFDIDPDGDETLQRSAAALGVDQVGATTGGAACLSEQGDFIQFVSHSANSVELARVHAVGLTLDKTFGAQGSSTAPSGGGRILVMHCMVNSPDGSVLQTVTEFNTQQPAQVSAGFTTCNGSTNLPTTGTTFGALIGSAGASGLDAYVLGIPGSNGVSPWTGALVLVGMSGIVQSTLGSVAPADIDPTWTHFFRVSGIGYDQSDGNLIIGVNTTDAVGTQNYIAKISATDATVMWTRAITALTGYPWSFTFSRINGSFHYLDSASLARHIDTSDGSQTTETVTGLSVVGPQFSDSTTNSIILYGTFSAGGSPPDYVGTYMDTGGHHTVFDVWIRFWFATVGPPPTATVRRQLGLLGPVRIAA